MLQNAIDCNILPTTCAGHLTRPLHDCMQSPFKNTRNLDNLMHAVFRGNLAHFKGH